jgi:hypothetical protein
MAWLTIGTEIGAVGWGASDEHAASIVQAITRGAAFDIRSPPDIVTVDVDTQIASVFDEGYPASMILRPRAWHAAAVPDQEDVSPGTGVDRFVGAAPVGGCARASTVPRVPARPKRRGLANLLVFEVITLVRVQPPPRPLHRRKRHFVK